MKCFLGKLRITGLLTILCILLLSTPVMADEQSGKEQTTTDIQSECVPIVYHDETSEGTEEIGPGIKKEVIPQEMALPEIEAKASFFERGASLGLFTATAYAPSSSGKIGRTYSGTIPIPQHTIAADLTVLPIGTLVMIDNIIYTVEDTGGSIKGNKVDIYFGSRVEAINFGRQTKEIFLVNVR